MKGSKLIAPAFDYELAAGTGTVSGDFDLEARPADILSAEESPTSAEKTIAGYYLDSSYTTPFAAATTEVAEGGTLDVYVKTEDKTAEQIIVTVDYVPHAYTPGSTNFKFEAPCAPELPQAQLTATTYTFNTGTTGAEILAAIGNPPEHQFWRPDVHEYGNCYWYISVSDVSQTPAPFNPVGFSLSESIMLFPQFTADMSYEPVVIKRGGNRPTFELTLGFFSSSDNLERRDLYGNTCSTSRRNSAKHRHFSRNGVKRNWHFFRWD